MDTTPLDRNQVAITTYRRANGSQAQTVKPRVERAPKVFPLAKAPSPEARRLANLRRTGRLCRVADCIQYALRVGGTCANHKHAT